MFATVGEKAHAKKNRKCTLFTPPMALFTNTEPSITADIVERVLLFHSTNAIKLFCDVTEENTKKSFKACALPK